MARSRAPRILGRSSVRAIAAPFAAASALMLAGSAAAAPQAPMTFHHVEGGQCPPSGCIVATGAIVATSVRDFTVYARSIQLQSGALMLLNSKGGDAVHGMKLGLALRRAGVSTRVQAYDPRTGDGAGVCTAACAYAFLGGVQRTISAGARLGLNQFAVASPRPGLEVADTQRILGLISTYAEAMGAAAGIAVVGIDTPAPRMHWLSTTELSAYAVVTKV